MTPPPAAAPAADPSAPLIAFIGGGHMASALAGGLQRAGHPAARTLVVEPDAAQRERLKQAFGIEPAAAADARLAGASTVVWAVKPQVFEAAAASCAAHVGAALQVSVMAGVRSAALVRATGSERVVRAMPNTPALIGQGIAGLYARPAVASADRATATALFAPTGTSIWVDDEDDLDAVTALSGSGPAYVFYLLEAMEQAAAAFGLDPRQGRLLARHTALGAAALALASEHTPATLRQQVTSKGGTTQAAIERLEAAGVRESLVGAMQAARDRAQALGGAAADDRAPSLDRSPAARP